VQLLVGVLRLFQKIIKAEIALAGSVEPDQINICVREQGKIKFKSLKLSFFLTLHFVFFLLRIHKTQPIKRQHNDRTNK